MNLDLGARSNSAISGEQIRNRIAAFIREDDGVTAIEYALMAALIAMVIVGSVGSVGTQLSGLWNYVADAVDAAVQ